MAWPQENRKKYDRAYLRMAYEWGKLSYCKRRQVGAIVVKDRMIISDGYNGTPTGFENICEDEEGYTKWYVPPCRGQCLVKAGLLYPVERRGDLIHHLVSLPRMQ